jgi:hypothetical protein
MTKYCNDKILDLLVVNDEHTQHMSCLSSRNAKLVYETNVWPSHFEEIVKPLQSRMLTGPVRMMVRMGKLGYQVSDGVSYSLEDLLMGKT